MATEAFSEEWAQEWCQLVNGNAEFIAAAAHWEGTVALVMTTDPSGKQPLRSVFMDLGHGRCRAARTASDLDLQTATYVLTGSIQAWKEVLGGRTAPLMAVLSGKIRLTRGSMGSLAPHANVAKGLLIVAMGMDATFPD